MTRLLQRSGGILVDWLAQSNWRSAPSGAPREIVVYDGSEDMPAQRLDHPTYLRRGIAIDGMALPAGTTRPVFSSSESAQSAHSTH